MCLSRSVTSDDACDLHLRPIGSRHLPVAGCRDVPCDLYGAARDSFRVLFCSTPLPLTGAHAWNERSAPNADDESLRSIYLPLVWGEEEEKHLVKDPLLLSGNYDDIPGHVMALVPECKTETDITVPLVDGEHGLLPVR